jgi:hypothetical protein
VYGKICEIRGNRKLIKPIKIPYKCHMELIRDDGYVNVTALCKKGGRKYPKWAATDQGRDVINLLSVQLGISKELLVESKPGRYGKTWSHPRVATCIALWISVGMLVEVTGWLEEWKNMNKVNRTRYAQVLETIEPDENASKEKEIQLRMQKEIGGEIEVKTPSGFIDLLTSDEIIEIKNGRSWKHGMGQVLVYADYYPARRRRLHLFDINPSAEIERICGKFDVHITYE